MEPDLFSILLAADAGGAMTWVPFLIIAGLLLLSALVSGSEVAFFSLTPADIQELETAREAEHQPRPNVSSSTKKPILTEHHAICWRPFWSSTT